MKKKILIFGGSGFIGGNISIMADQSWEAFIVSRRYQSYPSSIKLISGDIIDKSHVEKIILRVKPDIIVNAAAISDIDYAEVNKAIAFDINVVGSRNIAEICAEQNIKLIYLSSDSVFDGTQNNYHEHCLTNPLNYYGKTKETAERDILMTCKKYSIIRFSQVLGFPVFKNSKSFCSVLISTLRDGNTVKAIIDEIKTPIDVCTLSRIVLEIAENDFNGVIHVGSLYSINRYDLSCKIAEALGFDKKLIIPVNSENIKDRAKRHKNGILCTDLAKAILKTKLLTIDETIDEVYKSYLKYKQ